MIRQIPHFFISNFISLLVFIFLSLNGLMSHAQELQYGDSDTMQQMKQKASQAYSAFDSTYFLLTQKTFGSIKSYGTNMIVNTTKGDISRIVTFNHFADGIMSVEWYFEDGNLFLVYQVLEEHEEIKSDSNWRNFKGFKGWESRFYFIDDQLVCHRHKGRFVEEDYDTTEIKKQAYNLIKFVKKFTNDKE